MGHKHRLRTGLETTKTDLQGDGSNSNTPFCILPSNKRAGLNIPRRVKISNQTLLLSCGLTS